MIYIYNMLKLNLYFILFFVSFQLNAQALFEINDFKAFENDISLVEHAKIYDNRIRISPANSSQEGACWYSKSKIDLSLGFETEFTFLITGSGPNTRGGDGFAFVIQNKGTGIVGGKGDKIGYKEIPNVVAIEFDTYNNDEGSRNHINLSYYENGKKAYRRFATVHEIPEITDGKEHFTKISYRDGIISVFMDSYIFPLLTVQIDLSEKIGALDDQAWLGFTSSTSSAYANHDLIQWSLKQYLDAPEDINEEEIEVQTAQTINVKGRNLTIKVWDHNKIDGDVVSLKWNEEWILTEHELEKSQKAIKLDLHGFDSKLILFANNVGAIPPNTATISIYDGYSSQSIQLESDMSKSEAVLVKYQPE